MIGRCNEGIIRVMVGVFNITLVTVLLTGPIPALYLVRSNEAKLAIIATFTATCAITVGLITNTRRAEMFGATAA